jgi:hypothetical protein
MVESDVKHHKPNHLFFKSKLTSKIYYCRMYDRDSNENGIALISANIYIYYIWCGFHTISFAKSVTWYTEYLMSFFHCEETRRLVSIFKKILTLFFYFLSILTVNIAAMLLNLDPDIGRSGPRLHSFCSKQFSSFIVFLNNKIMMC